MPSLRDKLRSTLPPPKKPAAEKPAPCAPTECYTRRHEYKKEDFLLPGVLSGKTLSLVFGEPSPDLPLESILFLDTETTGLSGGAGTIAFETGIGWFEGEHFVLRQFVLRDYNEEEPMLKAIYAALEGKQAVCTFNGKTFDMPLLASRMIMHRMRLPAALYQMDLLHACRRVWKMRLGRCNLGSLEEKVLGRAREDDLPGAQVPERFFTYLKTHDFSLFEDVLQHNRQDVKSLAEILKVLLDAHADPLSLHANEDIFSVGRVLQKRGETVKARLCFRSLDPTRLSSLSRLQLADSLKKDHQPAQAAEVYEKMIQARQGGLFPYIALAKLYEHRLHDRQRALQLTEKALCIAAERNDPLYSELEKRYNRLNNKLRR